MSGVVWFGIIVFVLVVFVGRRNSLLRLMRDGRVARGILLRVDIPLTRWSAEGARTRFRSFRLHIDVELPGEPPYEIDDVVSFPTNMAKLILPGSTVELRVHPTNRSKVVIVGPGVGLGQSFFNPALAKRAR